MVSPIYKRNPEIREAKGKIPFWLIAEKMGIHENTLRLWLRKEISTEKKKAVLAAVEEIKKEYKEEN